MKIAFRDNLRKVRNGNYLHIAAHILHDAAHLIGHFARGSRIYFVEIMVGKAVAPAIIALTQA